MKNEVENKRVVSFDTGSAFSCAAYIEAGGGVHVIPMGDGSGKMPSDIYISPDGETKLFGEAARNMMPLEPDRVFQCYKRKLGLKEVLGSSGRREIIAEDLIELEAEMMVETVSGYLGFPASELLILLTVPAQFDQRQRQLVRAAYEKLGCSVLQTVNEPTAAVLAFDLPRLKGDCVAAVLDIGAGTADVSIVAVEGGKVSVLSTEGNNQMGGIDADNRVRDQIVAEFERQHGLMVSMESHPGDYCEIGDKARVAKEQLSTRRQASVNVRVDGKSVSTKLSRDELGVLIADIIEKLKSLTSKAIEAAGLTVADVDHVLLVGGSSRLTVIKEMATNLFGKSKILKSSVSPDFAVVEGGARLAARLVEENGNVLVDGEQQRIKLPLLKYQESSSFPVGVAVQESVDSDTKICSVLLPKNTPLPATVTEAFTSVTDDQRVFDIKILQGEEGQRMEECLIVGERDLEFEPRDHRSKSLEATIHYDRSSQCKVLIKDLVSGREEDITVDFVSERRSV